jgi:cell division protein FtsB
MQKIKYIIIFTLLLALAIIAVQLSDYQNITSSLLQENNSINKTTLTLNKEIKSLKEQNEILQAKILSLEEQLSRQNIESNQFNFSNENNTTINSIQTQEPIPVEQEKSIFTNDTTNEQNSQNIDVKPNIKIDDENEITGFGLEYKQKF